MILRSCSFRGLISHVVDKKCQVRLARQIAEMKNKKKFLEALSLGPNNNNGNNRPDNNQKVVSEPRKWKWIYGAPLPDKDPACGKIIDFYFEQENLQLLFSIFFYRL